jgi:hypothetical protein
LHFLTLLKLGIIFQHVCCAMRYVLAFGLVPGPFRSFGRLGFEPRPYQLVPLLMALKLNPIRLLIADDVGIARRLRQG